MEKILIAQFMAHLFADFYMQSENLCKGKQRSLFKSRHIYLHALIVFITSIGLTFTNGFILYAAGIAVLHFGIDAAKSLVERYLIKTHNLPEEGYYTRPLLFFTDQVLHLLVIYLATFFYWKHHPYVPAYINIFTINQLLIVAGFILCLKPTNVIIRICLSSLNLYPQKDATTENEDLQKAGRWIGSIERILAFVLVILGEYTAIGFIIAAKSVLRYGDNKTNKTEYVLIGTLLSFGIAILAGIGIQSGIVESFIGFISTICK